MSINFHPNDYYDINKSVLICGGEPPDDPVGHIVYEMGAFAKSLEISGLTTSIEDVVSGGTFGAKSHSKGLLLEVAFGKYTMRMLTSVRIMGKVVSIFSYESFHPNPVKFDMDVAGGEIVEVIAESLKRLDDVEFFLTMDQVFDLVHDHGISLVQSCSAAKIHTSTLSGIKKSK